MNQPPRPTRDERRRAAREERLAAEQAAQARARRTRRLWQLGAVAIVVVAAVAVAVALGASGGGSAQSAALKPGQKPAQSAQVAAELQGVPQHGITLGAPNAPVTLVEFADLKCPICRQYSLRTLPTLIDRYVRTGKVKIVFRTQHFVGEQENPGDSLAAGRMAEAAGLQDKLWSFAELFYANQQDETTRYATDAFLRRIASGVPGLDVARAMAQRSSPQVTAQLQEASALFARNGFTGTPSFLLGKGQALKPLPFTSYDPSAFAKPIDALLKG